MIDGLDGLSEVRVRRLIRGAVLGLAVCAGTSVCLWAQAAAAAVTGRLPVGRSRGTVKAGAVPLPGVCVTATNTLTGKKYATTTDVTGAFAMAIPRNGRYVVKAELAAFASETKEVLINAAGENGGKPEQVAEFGLQLASRVAQQEAATGGDGRTAATSLASAAGARDAVAECDGGWSGAARCECGGGERGCADAVSGGTGWWGFGGD